MYNFIILKRFKKNVFKIFNFFYRFNLNSNINFEELINHLPDQVTGADLYGMCHNAWLNSAKRIIQQRIGKNCIY